MSKLTEVAEHLGLSLTRVSQLVTAGILPEAPRGKHDLDASRAAYLAHLREVAAGRMAKDGGGFDLVAERARLAHAQAEKCERENRIADGLYLEVAVVHRLVTGSFARVRAKLLALPSKLAPLVSGTTSAKAQGALKSEIYAALNELGSTRLDGVSEEGEIIYTETGD